MMPLLNVERCVAAGKITQRFKQAIFGRIFDRRKFDPKVQFDSGRRLAASLQLSSSDSCIHDQLKENQGTRTRFDACFQY
jgi:hypothetical protein